MLPINPSFSSRQELLTSASPQHCRPNGPASSGLPSSTDGPIQSKIFTRASSLPGRLERRFRVEAPVEVGLLPADGAQLCGWGSFTPRALQVFNTPPWMLFFLCLASFLQGMIINGFVNTIITSIERRFDLRSSQTGLIASSYDIAACVCLAFVSYFGGTGHKPRWLGWGMLIMASGSLVFALPHFASAPYRASVSEQTELCAASRSSPCQDKEAAQSSYRFVFMLGQLLHGVGATPLYTLGVTYLDENVRSNYAPVYIGIFYTAAILGPAVGYLLGGYFLNIYTEIHLRTDLSPEDPHWVGAWWIGFLLGGAAVLLVSLPILGYPRQLPGSQEFVAMRVSEVHQLSDGSHSTASDPQFGRSAKDMPRSLLLLLKNPTFLFLCLAGATEATLIAGMSTFGPKFLESQFGLSASEAATWFGYMVVPAGGGGTFLGGYIVKKWNMRCRDIVRLCVVCTLISLVTIFIFLLHCPNMPMAGVTVPYRSGQVRNQQLHRGPTEPHRLAVQSPAAAAAERWFLLRVSPLSSSHLQFRPGGEPDGELQRSVWLRGPNVRPGVRRRRHHVLLPVSRRLQGPQPHGGVHGKTGVLGLQLCAGQRLLAPGGSGPLGEVPQLLPAHADLPHLPLQHHLLHLPLQHPGAHRHPQVCPRQPEVVWTRHPVDRGAHAWKYSRTHRLWFHDRHVLPAVAGSVWPPRFLLPVPERSHEPPHADGRRRLQGRWTDLLRVGQCSVHAPARIPPERLREHRAERHRPQQTSRQRPP
ncbi:solute carrier organic anion transporter family member 4A1 isoform X2 [Takifugu flavidus]|uniref:solute carrier organic anion transporter family member 4A1 isoform X2 n=1 Tax=Takifugu flavidus TaxID=433684 RepID=UPI002544CAFD|nr:solute carrier organic anion transporter family member 4A1 isoform X2 [Takifugu flavidus]